MSVVFIVFGKIETTLSFVVFSDNWENVVHHCPIVRCLADPCVELYCWQLQKSGGKIKHEDHFFWFWIKIYILLSITESGLSVLLCFTEFYCNLNNNFFLLYTETEIRQFWYNSFQISTESFTKGYTVSIQIVPSFDPDFTIAIICRIDLRFNDSSYSNIK